MRSSTFAALTLLVALAGNSQASELVVMGVNLNGPAPDGQKVYTIGVDTQGLAGLLEIRGLKFVGTGAGGSPKQSNFEAPSVAAYNPQNRQDVEVFAEVWGEVDFKQFDSWWYASGSGLLQTRKGQLITTDPIVGPTGQLWLPQAFGIIGGDGPAPGFGSGLDMGMYAVFGSFSASSPAGIYPLLQVRTSGDLLVGFAADTKLSVQADQGEVATNVLGGPQDVNPYAVLRFNEDRIVPEPSTYALAAIALTGLLAFGRRFRHRRIPRAVR
ncbi:MAG: PEP-CTERM sorting domain-containing protein [Planctomycetia bacterium]|nr:PEP-CTERM sorting domain-containing protein [Planctomycetia bacterium]